MDRFGLASALLAQEGHGFCVRLKILAQMSYQDVDHGSAFESGNTAPFVVHCGKGGVTELWGLDDGDVVVLASECFDDCNMRQPEQVWNCVLTACTDAWLKHTGYSAIERRRWLSKHLGKVNDAVIAAEQGHKLEWLSQCREWSWRWSGGGISFE